MGDQSAATSTPLAHLRAQAAAAKQHQAERVEITELPPEPEPEAPPAPPAPAPPAAPPAPPAASSEDIIADLGGVSSPLPPARGLPIPKLPTCLINPAALKIGLAVAVIFFVVTGLPVDALASKFAFLKKIPFSSTTIKALTAGLAAAAVSYSAVKISP